MQTNSFLFSEAKAGRSIRFSEGKWLVFAVFPSKMPFFLYPFPSRKLFFPTANKRLSTEF
jgi:hypothetical protein